MFYQEIFLFCLHFLKNCFAVYRILGQLQFLPTLNTPFHCPHASVVLIQSQLWSILLFPCMHWVILLLLLSRFSVCIWVSTGWIQYIIPCLVWASWIWRLLGNFLAIMSLNILFFCVLLSSQVLKLPLYVCWHAWWCPESLCVYLCSSCWGSSIFLFSNYWFFILPSQIWLWTCLVNIYVHYHIFHTRILIFHLVPFFSLYFFILGLVLIHCHFIFL